MNWLNILRVSRPSKVKLFVQNDDNTWAEFMGDLERVSIQDDVVDSLRYAVECLGRMPVPTEHTLSTDIRVRSVRHITKAIDADDYAAWEQMVLYGVQ